MLSIYLTDLSAYNKGCLHGKWIKLPCDNLTEELTAILKEGEQRCLEEYGYYEEHEEYFISDYTWEGSLDVCIVGEYSNVEQLNQNMELVEGLDEYTIKAMKYLLDDGIANDIQEAIQKADDVIIYEIESLEELGEQVLAETYGLDFEPKHIINYIDFKAYAEDLLLAGEFTQRDDGFYAYPN